ncbi:hypothetical protein Gbro_3433 [Gordonia bronchialis DSM 43247]|uniref:Uncharacterized protein n=1 Tax=Gordonia bronchialis (strain ATCC 25592 / DSM 43247 / BCRC 13721 / JCM 3198 / KCTC 3076 / NBRC 16047 / NCTC 10667) TaxID=526226 RepID=D0LE36_GORB4|nr:hypothetical protein [Gordonia bronchialis]ACY22628.1 hypothetical protein Gbro_3433 [Gordonia bronchialis DSM 43247]MCC3325409.1 hypothetical protein [Gordonia bronchialis]QGS23900.1 hypothetical protein FOB84_06625 [Gordonia bronchialis]STQ65567.1 Uncharacterised protein [Gordonia bronchialis]
MAGEGDITVDLEGEALDPRAVADAIEQIESLVASINDGDDARLILTNLRGGSAHISMVAADSPLDTLADGIEELRGGPVSPRGWTRDTLLATVGLAKVSARRGVESISLRIGDAVSAIDGVIQSNAEAALAPSSRGLGSVRGHLYRYTNDRGRRSAGLRRADTGEAIDLRFAAEDADQVRKHLEQQVEAWGEIARDATGHIAYVTVEGIEPVAGPHEPAPTSEGRGLLGSDWLGGADPAEWVRMMRG